MFRKTMRSFIRLFLLILMLFTVGCVQKENKQKIENDPVATKNQEFPFYRESTTLPRSLGLSPSP